MLFWESGLVEGSEPCYGCDPVSAKCPPGLVKHACIGLCYATAAEARHDLAHNCRCLVAGCALCRGEKADS